MIFEEDKLGYLYILDILYLIGVDQRNNKIVAYKNLFNRKTMFAVICPITSTIKNFPICYTLPEELDTKGQVLIFQLKSLDFKQRKLKKIKKFPLQDIAKIDQLIQYIF